MQHVAAVQIAHGICYFSQSPQQWVECGHTICLCEAS